MRTWGIALLAIAVILTGPTLRSADTLPSQITDDAFWRMITDFSESAGSFRFQFMSNEVEFAHAIPELKKSIRPGGVYLGVGPEQNFSYIAALRPKVAFVTDIRRENMLEHLIYKAVFEMSATRAEFVSRLFSRKPPAGLAVNASVRELFRAYGVAARDSRLFAENLRSIKARLMNDHRFPLSRTDQASIDDIYRTIVDDGLGSGPSGFFGGFNNLTYAQLMSAADGVGQPRSYLATEENFQTVREMERKNLIVPIVGDFAGTKALRSVGNYLKSHGAVVSVFYTSNVEQYLFEQQDDWRRFYTNVGALPVDATSTLVRSSHFAPGRVFRRTRASNYVMLLSSIADLLNAFRQGRVQDYDDVIQMSRTAGPY